MEDNRLTQLEAAIRDGAINERKNALDELAHYPADLAVPILQRLASEPNFLCRRFAVMGLGNHRVPAALACLQDLMARETDQNVMAEIANSLFEFGEASVPLLQELFEQNSHWLTRQTILAILMESNQDQVLLAVIQAALKDETQTVRETAILALGSLLKGNMQSDAVALLIDLAEAEFWRDRWRAATALNLATDPRVRPVLAKLQQDPNHYVAAAALDASLPKF
jgi:HEAT repeat protein